MEAKFNEYLKGIVANLPEKPGIYQYLNSEGTIIYVGKAKNLKKRVYSYFSKEHEPGVGQQNRGYSLHCSQHGRGRSPSGK